MGSFRGERSGQIIVVAALLLAVVFVGLALILNSAIYAENLATRGETTTGEAMAVEGLTADHLQEAIDAENYGIEEDTYAARRSRLEANVSEWNRVMGPKQARTGGAYSVAVTSATNGTRVNQSTKAYFEPANNSVLDSDPLGLGASTNWQTANESKVRAFEMTVQRDSLKTTNGTLANTVQELLDATLDGTSVFWTQFEGDDTYRMYLLNDSDNDSVAAVVTDYEDDSNETVIGTCSADAPAPTDNVTVGITAAEVDGADGVTECPALERVDESRQNLYYAGVDHVEGTYRFLADRPEDEFRQALADAHNSLLAALTITSSDVYSDSPTDTNPYTTTAIYGITVETTYRDGRITAVHNTTFPATAR